MRTPFEMFPRATTYVMHYFFLLISLAHRGERGLLIGDPTVKWLDRRCFLGNVQIFFSFVQMHILLLHLILWMVLALGKLSAPETLRSATEDSSNRQQGRCAENAISCVY